jgi:hypothetical protein
MPVQSKVPSGGGNFRDYEEHHSKDFFQLGRRRSLPARKKILPSHQVLLAFLVILISDDALESFLAVTAQNTRIVPDSDGQVAQLRGYANTGQVCFRA